MKNFWIRNTKNEPSASLTLLVVAFLVVILHMLLSIFVNPFGLAISPFNATEAMMVLSPLLATYFGRRYSADIKETEVHLKHKNKKQAVVGEE